jgi:hypothetical protein
VFPFFYSTRSITAAGSPRFADDYAATNPYRGSYAGDYASTTYGSRRQQSTATALAVAFPGVVSTSYLALHVYSAVENGHPATEHYFSAAATADV